MQINKKFYAKAKYFNKSPKNRFTPSLMPILADFNRFQHSVRFFATKSIVLRRIFIFKLSAGHRIFSCAKKLCKFSSSKLYKEEKKLLYH